MSLVAATLPLWGWAAYRDVRTRRAPDWLWLVLGGVGVAVSVVAGTWPIALAGSFALFGFGAWLFSAGGLGGADVKALAVLPWLAPWQWPTALVLALPAGMAVALGCQRWQGTDAAPMLVWPALAMAVALLL